MSNLEHISDADLSLEIDKLDMQLIVKTHEYNMFWPANVDDRETRADMELEIANLTARRVALAEEWLRRYREQNSR